MQPPVGAVPSKSTVVPRPTNTTSRAIAPKFSQHLSPAARSPRQDGRERTVAEGRSASGRRVRAEGDPSHVERAIAERSSETATRHERPATRREGDVDRDPEAEMVPLDALSRALWEPGFAFEPRAVIACAPSFVAAAPPSSIAGPTLDAMLDRFVRRVAMSGDRRRGTAHLEIGSGDLAGGTLTVTADGPSLSIVLDLPADADAEGWRRRLLERLRQRGLDAEVEIRR
jgi:hypothetical protein